MNKKESKTTNTHKPPSIATTTLKAQSKKTNDKTEFPKKTTQSPSINNNQPKPTLNKNTTLASSPKTQPSKAIPKPPTSTPSLASRLKPSSSVKNLANNSKQESRKDTPTATTAAEERIKLEIQANNCKEEGIGKPLRQNEEQVIGNRQEKQLTTPQVKKQQTAYSHEQANLSVLQLQPKQEQQPNYSPNQHASNTCTNQNHQLFAEQLCLSETPQAQAKEQTEQTYQTQHHYQQLLQQPTPISGGRQQTHLLDINNAELVQIHHDISQEDDRVGQPKQLQLVNVSEVMNQEYTTQTYQEYNIQPYQEYTTQTYHESQFKLHQQATHIPKQTDYCCQVDIATNKDQNQAKLESNNGKHTSVQEYTDQLLSPRKNQQNSSFPSNNPTQNLPFFQTNNISSLSQTLANNLFHQGVSQDSLLKQPEQQSQEQPEQQSQEQPQQQSQEQLEKPYQEQLEQQSQAKQNSLIEISEITSRNSYLQQQAKFIRENKVQECATTVTPKEWHSEMQKKHLQLELITKERSNDLNDSSNNLKEQSYSRKQKQSVPTANSNSTNYNEDQTTKRQLIFSQCSLRQNQVSQSSRKKSEKKSRCCQLI